ncbi:hypothetical protein ACS0TY_029715 [Phlomoides rotata]
MKFNVAFSQLVLTVGQVYPEDMFVFLLYVERRTLNLWYLYVLKHLLPSWKD